MAYNVGVIDLSGQELPVVESLAEVERQFDIAHKNAVLKFVGLLAELVAHLPHQGDQRVVLFGSHVQGFVDAVVEERILLDAPFERGPVQQVGMKQKRPAGDCHPFAVVLLASHLSGSHAQEGALVVIVFATTVVELHIGIVAQENTVHAVIVQAVADG